MLAVEPPPFNFVAGRMGLLRFFGALAERTESNRRVLTVFLSEILGVPEDVASEDACMTPLAFCDIARLAGLPPGALNVVTGLGEEAGDALTHHRDIDFVTFTGSPC